MFVVELYAHIYKSRQEGVCGGVRRLRTEQISGTGAPGVSEGILQGVWWRRGEVLPARGAQGSDGGHRGIRLGHIQTGLKHIQMLYLINQNILQQNLSVCIVVCRIQYMLGSTMRDTLLSLLSGRCSRSWLRSKRKLFSVSPFHPSLFQKCGSSNYKSRIIWSTVVKVTWAFPLILISEEKGAKTPV